MKKLTSMTAATVVILMIIASVSYAGPVADPIAPPPGHSFAWSSDGKHCWHYRTGKDRTATGHHLCRKYASSGKSSETGMTGMTGSSRGFATKRSDIEAINPSNEGGLVGNCTSTAQCLDGLLATCEGFQLCLSGIDETPNQEGYATCDEVQYFCPEDSGAGESCIFEGVSYPNGSDHTLGARCSSHRRDSYCIGGAWPGDACDSSGDCYASCDSGTWVH